MLNCLACLLACMHGRLLSCFLYSSHVCACFPELVRACCICILCFFVFARGCLRLSVSFVLACSLAFSLRVLAPICLGFPNMTRAAHPSHAELPSAPFPSALTSFRHSSQMARRRSLREMQGHVTEPCTSESVTGISIGLLSRFCQPQIGDTKCRRLT